MEVSFKDICGATLGVGTQPPGVLRMFPVQVERVTTIWYVKWSPPSRFRAYTCVYAYTGANFFLLFLILSVEKDTTLLTLQKITVFPGFKASRIDQTKLNIVKCQSLPLISTLGGIHYNQGASG